MVVSISFNVSLSNSVVKSFDTLPSSFNFVPVTRFSFDRCGVGDVHNSPIKDSLNYDSFARLNNSIRCDSVGSLLKHGLLFGEFKSLLEANS